MVMRSDLSLRKKAGNIITNDNIIISMGRKERIWYPGAVFHIMSRGNYRQNIFRNKEDYQVFLQLVEDAMKRYDFELHGFCCMTNHFHMLLETGEKEIWIIMKRINQLYAAYYNNKYGLIGHLFQGRYRSCLVRDDSYFLQTSRYIVSSTVVSGAVNKLLTNRKIY